MKRTENDLERHWSVLRRTGCAGVVLERSASVLERFGASESVHQRIGSLPCCHAFSSLPGAFIPLPPAFRPDHAKRFTKATRLTLPPMLPRLFVATRRSHSHHSVIMS